MHDQAVDFGAVKFFWAHRQGTAHRRKMQPIYISDDDAPQPPQVIEISSDQQQAPPPAPNRQRLKVLAAQHHDDDRPVRLGHVAERAVPAGCEPNHQRLHPGGPLERRDKKVVGPVARARQDGPERVEVGPRDKLVKLGDAGLGRRLLPRLGVEGPVVVVGGAAEQPARPRALGRPDAARPRGLVGAEALARGVGVGHERVDRLRPDGLGRPRVPGGPPKRAKVAVAVVGHGPDGRGLAPQRQGLDLAPHRQLLLARRSGQLRLLPARLQLERRRAERRRGVVVVLL